MKLTFKKEPSTSEYGWNHHDLTTVTVETKEVSLDNILEDFTAFLKACGFNPKGQLEFFEEEEVENEK